MAADRHFRKTRFEPDIRLRIGGNETVKEAVASGFGIGVISRHALHGLRREHGVCVLDVEGFPVPSAGRLVRPAAKRLSPLAQDFKAHLQREVANGRVGEMRETRTSGSTRPRPVGKRLRRARG